MDSKVSLCDWIRLSLSFSNCWANLRKGCVKTKTLIKKVNKVKIKSKSDMFDLKCDQATCLINAIKAICLINDPQ